MAFGNRKQIVLYANKTDLNGNIFTVGALRRMASIDKRLEYDDKNKCLIYTGSLDALSEKMRERIERGL